MMLTITESVNAILTSKESFGEKFYAQLFTGYPHLKQHFEGVNMREQAVVVTMALSLIEQYYSRRNDATHKYLQVLGSRHCERRIPEESYADWLDALMETLSAFHEHAWNEALADQWKEAIEKATQVILEGYNRRYHV